MIESGIKWKFFSRANLRCAAVTPNFDSVNFKGQIKPEYRTDKHGARANWQENATTVHDFHSLVEGVDPFRQVNGKDNPPIKLHGLCGDYDAKVDRQEVEKALTRCGDMRPNLYQKSLSGNARFYWFFTEPIMVPSFDFAVHFLTFLSKKLKLNKVLPGLDDGILGKGFATPLCNSCEWEEIAPAPTIPQNMLVGWLMEAARSYRADEKLEIPLVAIKAALEAKYLSFKNSNWGTAQFEIGTTGVRFWDDTADHARGCVLRAGGFQCFTGSVPWKSWEDLLGKEFISNFTAQKLGDSANKIWYDGQYFWERTDHEQKGFSWTPFNCDQIKRHLKVDYKLDKNQVDEAIAYIERKKQIYGALPFFHKQRGEVFWRGGKRYLNTAMNEPTKPCEQTGIRWTQNDLGWIYDFYQDLFPDKHQLDLFLSWLSRFYKTLISGEPLQSLILFLAGPVHRGKNLSSEIITKLVGEAVDAGQYFLQSDNFNAELFQYPLWRVDDASACATEELHRKYSALIKKVAANRDFRSRDLYKTAKMVEWMGIVIVTLNTDAESVRMLPDPDGSLLDKILVLRTSEVAHIEFLPGEQQMDVIKEVLPQFARFLLEYEIPADCVGQARYGVKSYQEASMLRAAKQSSPANGFLEILRIYLRQYFASNKEAMDWQGNATELLNEMNAIQSLQATVRAYNSAHRAGRMLSQLKQQGFELQNLNCHSGRLWRIPRSAKFLEDYDTSQADEELLPDTGSDNDGNNPF